MVMAARRLSYGFRFVAVLLSACTSDDASENSTRDDTQIESTTTQRPSSAAPSEQFQQAFGTSERPRRVPREVPNSSRSDPGRFWPGTSSWL